MAPCDASIITVISGIDARCSAAPSSVAASRQRQVRDGAEVLELVWVDDAAYREDESVKDLKGKHAEDLVL